MQRPPEDFRTSFAEMFNDQRVGLSLEAFPTLHASFRGRAASERKVGKLASRRCWTIKYRVSQA